MRTKWGIIAVLASLLAALLVVVTISGCPKDQADTNVIVDEVPPVEPPPAEMPPAEAPANEMAPMNEMAPEGGEAMPAAPPAEAPAPEPPAG